MIFCTFTGEIGRLDHLLIRVRTSPSLLSLVRYFKWYIMKRINYKQGEKIGDLIFIKEVDGHKLPCGIVARKALFKCKYCGKEFASTISRVKKGGCKSCGCYALKTRTKHGLCGTSIYKRWNGMLQRCGNPNNPNYKHYGGRGVKVYDGWNDFAVYYLYVSGLIGYGEGLTIDRIDNDGNYEPGNVRWVDRGMQAVNQRRRSNATGYTGVYISRDKFESKLNYKSKTFRMGIHSTIKEALRARNEFIIKNKLPHKVQSYTL